MDGQRFKSLTSNVTWMLSRRPWKFLRSIILTPPPYTLRIVWSCTSYLRTLRYYLNKTTPHYFLAAICSLETKIFEASFPERNSGHLSTEIKSRMTKYIPEILFGKVNFEIPDVSLEPYNISLSLSLSILLNLWATSQPLNILNTSKFPSYWIYLTWL